MSLACRICSWPGDGLYLYKGSARNLVERLKDHRAGRVSRTKNHRPLTLVYYQYFDDYTAARKQELFLKSGQGRAWLKAHLASQQTVPPEADPQAENLLAMPSMVRIHPPPPYKFGI